jgi:hypothetical protein
LQTVWDELEALPKMDKAKLIDQPENVKIKLLPFQREGGVNLFISAFAYINVSQQLFRCCMAPTARRK